MYSTVWRFLQAFGISDFSSRPRFWHSAKMHGLKWQGIYQRQTLYGLTCQRQRMGNGKEKNGFKRISSSGRRTPFVRGTLLWFFSLPRREGYQIRRHMMKLIFWFFYSNWNLFIYLIHTKRKIYINDREFKRYRKQKEGLRRNQEAYNISPAPCHGLEILEFLKCFQCT